jgi:hypothetical protein
MGATGCIKPESVLIVFFVLVSSIREIGTNSRGCPSSGKQGNDRKRENMTCEP